MLTETAPLPERGPSSIGATLSKHLQCLLLITQLEWVCAQSLNARMGGCMDPRMKYDFWSPWITGTKGPSLPLFPIPGCCSVTKLCPTL